MTTKVGVAIQPQIISLSRLRFMSSAATAQTTDATRSHASHALIVASVAELSPHHRNGTGRSHHLAEPGLAAATSPDLVKTMDLVRKFSFDHGLLGEGARTVDAVGIEFPGGATLGDKKNIKMRFDATYMKQAADGKL